MDGRLNTVRQVRRAHAESLDHSKMPEREKNRSSMSRAQHEKYQPISRLDLDTYSTLTSLCWSRMQASNAGHKDNFRPFGHFPSCIRREGERIATLPRRARHLEDDTDANGK